MCRVRMGLVLLIVILAGCASSSSDSATLLVSWKEQGEANWSLKPEGISASKGGGYLVSTEPFSDYVLTIEFSADPEVNSGVFVNCLPGKEITPLNCYEINIWDNHPNQAFRTGAIVTKVAPFEKLDTLGQWNTYKIRVSESAITVHLNDVLVSDLSGLDKTSGHIALQYLGMGDVRFRNVMVIPL